MGQGGSACIHQENAQLYDTAYYMRTDLKDLLKDGLK